MAKAVLSCVAVACLGVFLSASAIAAPADFVPGTMYTCNMHLATGQAYVLESRTLHWKKNETELYTTAVA